MFCFAVSFLILVTATFKKVGIEEESRSHEHALFTGIGIHRKGNIKGIRVRQEFNPQRLWRLDNLANEGSIAVGLTLHGGWKHVKGHLATTLAAARVAFGAAIHATSSTARGWVDNVNAITRCIIHGKSRDAIVVVLLDAAELFTAGREGGHLIAAALATACWTSEGTVDRQELSLRVHFLDLHLEAINGNKMIYRTHVMPNVREKVVIRVHAVVLSKINLRA
jgi:hypothetical protein